MIVGRDHSVAELRRKLGRRGYLEAEIDAAQARLMQNGWLGDRRFAERYARRRSRSLGPMAISAELARSVWCKGSPVLPRDQVPLHPQRPFPWPTGPAHPWLRTMRQSPTFS